VEGDVRVGAGAERDAPQAEERPGSSRVPLDERTVAPSGLLVLPDGLVEPCLLEGYLDGERRVGPLGTASRARSTCAARGPAPPPSPATARSHSASRPGVARACREHLLEGGAGTFAVAAPHQHVAAVGEQRGPLFAGDERGLLLERGERLVPGPAPGLQSP